MLRWVRPLRALAKDGPGCGQPHRDGTGARIVVGLLRFYSCVGLAQKVKDSDYRSLRLVLGSPSFEYAETEENGKLATFAWSCGCEATQERFQKYCDVQWCEFHCAALLPSEPNWK